jgi:hypothetical protein
MKPWRDTFHVSAGAIKHHKSYKSNLVNAVFVTIEWHSNRKYIVAVAAITGRGENCCIVTLAASASIFLVAPYGQRRRMTLSAVHQFNAQFAIFKSFKFCGVTVTQEANTTFVPIACRTHQWNMEGRRTEENSDAFHASIRRVH